MNTALDDRRLRLSASVWKFHSLLNTAWPKPSAPDMAGASIFIRTNLFTALEDGLRTIRSALDTLQEGDFKHELLGFWTAFTALFLKMKGLDEPGKTEQIDRAVNLLYLGSGIFYHRLLEGLSVRPHHDQRLIGVEDMDTLLRLCNWTNPGTTTKDAIDRLTQQMAALTRTVK